MKEKQCKQTWITPGIKYMRFKVETVHIKGSNLTLINFKLWQFLSETEFH